MTTRIQRFNPAPRLLRRLALIPACVALIATGSSLPATPASAAVTPQPATASSPRPAAVGPGERPNPSAVPESAVYTCAAVAYKAGFRFYPLLSTNDGNQRPIVVAIAVGLAESGCNPSAVNYNGPTSGCPNGSTDRGLWQINNCYHPEVSDACAYQAQCNADAAWNISSQGTNWSPWSTYNSGAWKSYVSDAGSIVNNGFTLTFRDHGTNTCLDADSQQAYNGGKIFQWSCSSSDAYQQWTVSDVSGHNPILKNVGTHTCLDADGSQTGDGALIFQWACNSTSDNYQQWWVDGSGQYNTNGDANARLQNQGKYYAGSNICADADSQQAYNGGKIFQWVCSSSDTYQQWN
jgi:hypothetical protein